MGSFKEALSNVGHLQATILMVVDFTEPLGLR
jgi:hypothetical protein